MSSEVELTQIDNLNDDSDPVEYPCVILGGVETESEFLFFMNRKVDKPDICLPMYFECEGEMVKLGQFQLDLDYLLAIRSIGKYEVTLCRSESDTTKIDLDNPDTLMKFIKL